VALRVFETEADIVDRDDKNVDGRSNSSRSSKDVPARIPGLCSEDKGPLLKATSYPKIKLDPIEHQAYMWVTEEEVVRDLHMDGFPFVSISQKNTMLEGFRMLEAGLEPAESETIVT